MLDHFWTIQDQLPNQVKTKAKQLDFQPNITSNSCVSCHDIFAETLVQVCSLNLRRLSSLQSVAMDGRPLDPQDPVRARAKRTAWAQRVCEHFPLPCPFWPLGDRDPPPEQDPFVLGKKGWERASKVWKAGRIAAHLAERGPEPPCPLLLGTCPPFAR